MIGDHGNSYNLGNGYVQNRPHPRRVNFTSSNKDEISLHQRCVMVTTGREEDRSETEGRANSEPCSIATLQGDAHKRQNEMHPPLLKVRYKIAKKLEAITKNLLKEDLND